MALACRYQQPHGQLRWELPFVLDLMQPPQPAQGGRSPGYDVPEEYREYTWGQPGTDIKQVRPGKYGSKLLLMRLWGLQAATILDDYQQYILATEALISRQGTETLEAAIARASPEAGQLQRRELILGVTPQVSSASALSKQAMYSIHV